MASNFQTILSQPVRAVKVMIDQRTFFVASIDDLIVMKRKAGRPQDLLDIEQLEDIQKRVVQQGT